ncbi:MAG: HAD family hydrolase [Vicinamibacteria bacterium]
MKVRKLIVFDLDGTLVDSLADIASALNGTLARLSPGAPRLSRDAVRSLVGHGAWELVARALPLAALDVPVEKALALFRDIYRAGLLDETRPYPGVVVGLDRLRSRTLAVLTNKPGDLSRSILEGLGLADRFIRIYGGGDVAGKKPDPEGLARLLAETGTRASEGLMVGDSAVDVRTARNAGVGAVGVSYGFDPSGLAAEGPDLIVDSLEALADRLERGDL